MISIFDSTAILFIILTLITVFIFYRTASKNKWVLWLCTGMGLLQAILGLTGFYQVTSTIPPRFPLLLLPSVILIVVVFLSKKGRMFVDSLNIKWMTLLHIIRIPVELLLYFIFLKGLIPVEMTFEGYNFDILSGLSAPFVYYMVFYKRWATKSFLLFWNFIGLGLLITIVTIAILAFESPFQQLAFDQPNIGVTLFPLVWLPSIVVPIVLLSHLASIKQLIE